MLDGHVRLRAEAATVIEVDRRDEATVSDAPGHFGEDEVGATIAIEVFHERGDLDQAQGAFLLRPHVEVKRLRRFLREAACGALDIYSHMILPGGDQVNAAIPIKISYHQLRQAVDKLQGIIPDQAMLPFASKQQRRLIELNGLPWSLGRRLAHGVEHQLAELRDAQPGL